MTNKIILNEEQEQAANHVDGPCLVLACPGSGKTRCVVERTCRLIEKGISPRSILSITFTNKAAGEMKERTMHRLGAAAQQIYISTFHALCANILRKYGGAIGYSESMTICDSDDQESRMSQVARQFGHEIPSSTIAWICQRVNTLREELVPESQWSNEFQILGKPQFTAIAKEYIARLRSSNSTDFSGLLSETLRLFDEDKATLQKLQSRFSYIQVDETQDTNYAQFKIFLSIGIHNNLFIVGDSDQCQPAGTMVETITGPVPIEELDPKKHKLISYDRRSSIVTGRRHGFSFQKSSRPYDSSLIQVKAGGFSTACTPNHKWTVKLNNSIDGSHVVYLMRQGTKWRVGSCAMYKSRGKKAKTMFGPSLRARQERADGLWLLTVCANACEARAVEQIISCKYGIPMTCFHTDASTCGYTNYVFRTLTELENKAKKCLSDYGRLMEYPIWTKSKAINQDHGKRIPLMVHACNLLEGYMQVPVPTKGKDFEWSDIELDRQLYKGNVYSLDVDKYEHYIADGIITHNSIYGWRGARYKNIQDFINDKKAKIIVLPKNYRSTPEIVAAANALIKHNKDRQHQFDFSTVNASGEPVELFVTPTSDLEGKWIGEKIAELIEDDGYKPEDIAVLYRLNSMSRSIEQGLISCGVSYEVIGGLSFFDRMEIRDAIAMLKFYINNNDSSALSRFINSPTRGIGEVSLGKIENFARDNGITLVQALARAGEIFSGHSKDSMVTACKKIAQTFSIKQSSGEDIGDVLFFLTDNLNYAKHLESEKYADTTADRKNNLKSFIESCSEYSKQNGNDIGAYLNQIMLTTSSDKKGESGSVSLMTMHASKGLEFKVVFLPCLVDGLMPHKRAVQEREGGLEEERRLCYVGMTRAQERLILSYYSKSFVKNYSKSAHKSAGNYSSTMPSVFLNETSMLKHCKKGEVAYGKL